MSRDPDDHDAVLKDFAPPAQADDAKLPISAWAVVSCALGLIGIVLVGEVGGTIAIFGIICAFAARHDIKGGVKGGRAWASTGLWVSVFAFALGILVNVLNRR